MASQPPKSILKKTSYKPSPLSQSPTTAATTTTTTTTTTPQKPTPSEARAIALSHAHALQIRKALELSILTSLEQLLDFPPPTPDTTTLKLHLRFFQPSDYDSLIEERNILSQCGYVLCAHPKPSSTPSKYVLVDKGLASMRFVERSKLERFCSDTCARRALWLRVQLAAEPSWLRTPVVDGVEVGPNGEVYGLDLDGMRWAKDGSENELTLLEEVETRRGVGAVSQADLRKLVEELHGLGIESKGLLSGKKETVPVGGENAMKILSFNVEEKEVSSAPVLPVADVTAAIAAMAIEGYIPRRRPEDYLPKRKPPPAEEK